LLLLANKNSFFKKKSKKQEIHPFYLPKKDSLIQGEISKKKLPDFFKPW